MKRIAKVKRPRRVYESPLRDEQAERTRERVVEGLVRTMAKGVAHLSIPAVAREAHVSVPTVYRHFKTKAELVAALQPYYAKKTGLMELGPVRGPADLARLARESYRKLAAMDDTIRAAMASELGQDFRRSTIPLRLTMIRKAVDQLGPELPPRERARFARLLLILTSSAVYRAFRDYLALEPDVAAADVGWALRSLLRGLRAGR